MGDSAGIVLRIFAFYIFIAVVLGLVGGSFLASESFGQPESDDLNEPDSFFDFFSGEEEEFSFFRSAGYFFGGIGFIITGLPAWANLILFAPLGATILYLIIQAIIDLIPG